MKFIVMIAFFCQVLTIESYLVSLLILKMLLLPPERSILKLTGVGFAVLNHINVNNWRQSKMLFKKIELYITIVR